MTNGILEVENTITGSDSSIRGATVRVSSKDGSMIMLLGPLSLLYPLEIHCPSVSFAKTNTIERTNQSSTNQYMVEEVPPTG